MSNDTFTLFVIRFIHGNSMFTSYDYSNPEHALMHKTLMENREMVKQMEPGTYNLEVHMEDNEATLLAVRIGD